MNKNSRWLETLVGLFVIAGFAALVVLVFRVSNFSQFTAAQTYHIVAAFENVSGLKVRSAVSMAGVTIGRVRAIRIDPQTFEALVSMDIDAQYNNIPVDSSFAIYTAGLLGEKYVGVEPGGAPEYLAEGSRVNLTQSSVVLEKLISQFLFSKAEE